MNVITNPTPVADRADAWAALYAIEDEIQALHDAARDLRTWLRDTPASVTMRRPDLLPEPIIIPEPVAPAPRPLIAYPNWLLDMPSFPSLCSPQTREYDGRSHQDDLDRDIGVDLLAIEVEAGTDLKLDLARALNASRLHGRVRQDGNWKPDASTEKRRDGSTFKRFVSEQLNWVSSPWNRPEFDLSIVAIAFEDRYVVVEYTRRHLSMSNPAHRKLFARVCVGRPAPSTGTRFIYEPVRMLESPGTADDASDLAQTWYSELRLMDDDFDRHEELDSRLF